MKNSFHVETISRCWIFVNWRSREIDGVYSETNQGLLALVGDAAYEAGVDEELMQEFIYSRDFVSANELLIKGRSSYIIVAAWFVPPLEVIRS